LVGRDLPDVTSELSGLPRSGLYPSMQVSISALERKRLLECYRRKVARCGEHAGVDEKTQEHCLASLEQSFKSELVDFSFLDAPAQIRIIQMLVDPGYEEEFRQANQGMGVSYSSTPSPPSRDEQERLAQYVSPEAFARRMSKVIRTPWKESSTGGKGTVSSALCREYFQLACLRLLLTTGDDWRNWDRELLPRYVSGAGAGKAGSAHAPSLHPSVRAVFWDVYGTLLIPTVGDLEARLSRIESSEDYLSAMQAGGLDVSQAAEDPAGVFRELIKRSHEKSRAVGVRQPEVVIENIWQQLIERVLPGQWATWAQAQYIAACFELETNPVALASGAPEALESVHSLGCTQGILSNAQFYTAPILRHALGEDVWSLLDPELLLWSYRMGAAKPDPGPFAHAQALLQARGIAPQEVVLIGDNPVNDVRAAKKWGWKTILIEHSGTAVSDTEERPTIKADCMCANLSEVCNRLAAFQP
jgi:FMN phosphatase YigB (HAD superfamily)